MCRCRKDAGWWEDIGPRRRKVTFSVSNTPSKRGNPNT